MPEDVPDTTKLVVGLGNPGRSYAATRHNLGFRVVEALAARWGAGAWRRAFGGQVCDVRPRRGPVERRVLLLEPLAFMNASGPVVRDVSGYYRIGRADVLIVLDDLALPVGRLRARAEGSSGGHNGLSDVLAKLGGPDVARLRIGIGACPPQMDSAAYVLQAFPPEQRETVEQAVQAAAEAVEDWVFRGIDYVMERYNRKGDE